MSVLIRHDKHLSSSTGLLMALPMSPSSSEWREQDHTAAADPAPVESKESSREEIQHLWKAGKLQWGDLAPVESRENPSEEAHQALTLRSVSGSAGCPLAAGNTRGARIPLRTTTLIFTLFPARRIPGSGAERHVEVLLTSRGRPYAETPLVAAANVLIKQQARCPPGRPAIHKHRSA